MPLLNGDALDAVAEAVDWEANPYPQTHPKHCEFQRNLRATTIDRLGLDAAKLMRLSDFAAEAYHHDVAAAHRMAKRRDGTPTASQATTPRRVTGSIGGQPAPNGVPPIRMGGGGGGMAGRGAHIDNKALSSAKGFHQPLPMRVQVVPAGAVDDGTPTARITCSATLYGGQYVLFGCDDGALHVRQRTSVDRPPAHTTHISEHTRCNAAVDARTTQRAAEDGLMGTATQCATGVWVSRRFHRAVCRSFTTYSGPAVASGGSGGARRRLSTASTHGDGVDATVVPPPHATTMCATHDGAFVAIGASDGTLQLWHTATMEGVALLEPPGSGLASPDDEAPAAVARDGQQPPVVQLRPLRGVAATTAAIDQPLSSLLPRSNDTPAQRDVETQAQRSSSPTPSRYEFLVLYADGTVARVAFAAAASTAAAVHDATAAQHSPLLHAPTAALSFVLVRPQLIKGTCVPASLCVATDESCAYLSNQEGQFVVVDVADLHIATRCHVAELFARAQQTTQPTPSSTAGGAPGKTTSTVVTLAAPEAYVSAMDAFESFVAMGLSTGECVLLKKLQGTLSRSIFAVMCHHKQLALQGSADGQPLRSSAVSALKICASSMEVVALLGASELVVWSLASDLSYCITRRSVLPPVGSATNRSNDSSTNAQDPAVGPVELALHTHVDAMEVWSAGADGLNYMWMSEFQRTSSEVTEAHAACVAVAQANGMSLIDGHMTIARSGAESELAVQTSTDDLRRASDAGIFRRYFWSWMQFRLQHQLQRKQQLFSDILSRHVVTLRGRNYFRRWATFRAERVRQKHLAHAASALATVKQHQMLLGALLLWGRYAAKLRRTRTLHTRAALLQEAIERRKRHVAFQRLRNYVRVQRLDRRWTALAACLAQASDRSTMRRSFMSWWSCNVARKEAAVRLTTADRLANVSANPSVAAKAWCTWRSVCEHRRRKVVLQQWSHELAEFGDPQRAKAWLTRWIGVVYARRRETTQAAVHALEAREATLTSSITVAAPRAQRFHNLSALNQRLSALQERMRDLGEVQDAIATRVTAVRATQMLAASDGRSCSPLCLQTAGAPVPRPDATSSSAPPGTPVGDQADRTDSHRGEGSHDQRVSVQFPNVMLRLKGSLLNLATDGQWLHTCVDRARSVGAPKQFLHTVHLLEKHTRALFAEPPADTVAASEQTCATGARRASTDSSNGLGIPLDLWVPDNVTETDLRTAVVAMVDTDPHAAHTLLRCLTTLVVVFDCMTPIERRTSVPEAMQEAIVHHEEFLGILHDALTRSGITTA